MCAAPWSTLCSPSENVRYRGSQEGNICPQISFVKHAQIPAVALHNELSPFGKGRTDGPEEQFLPTSKHKASTFLAAARTWRSSVPRVGWEESAGVSLFLTSLYWKSQVFCLIPEEEEGR